MNPKQFKLFPRLLGELLPWGPARGCQVCWAWGSVQHLNLQGLSPGKKGQTREEVGVEAAEVGSGQGGPGRRAALGAEARVGWVAPAPRRRILGPAAVPRGEGPCPPDMKGHLQAWGSSESHTQEVLPLAGGWC